MRDRICKAAATLFLKHGFAGTSTNAITAEAGVSKETVYRYYSSKEDLFVEVLQHYTIEHLNSQFRQESFPELKNRNAVRDILLSLANDIVAVMMQPDYLALLRIVIAETSRFPQVGELFRSAVPERSLKYVSGLLKEMNALKMIRETDYDAAARMFVGSLLTYTLLDGLLASEKIPQKPSPEQIEMMVDLFMRQLER
jgi:AcrR family transcriptional regulator